MTLLVALASILAGCAGGPPTTHAGAGTPGDAEAAQTTEAHWDGTLRAGAAYELPAHFPETAPLLHPMWGDSMRTFELEAVPEALSVVMTWSGAPGTRMQLMIEAPPDEAGDVHLFTSPEPGGFTDAPEICVAVPPDVLATGRWQFMAHTLAGADINFRMTAQMTGGAGAYRDGHEGWMTLQEYADRAREGTIMDHAAPCGPG